MTESERRAARIGDAIGAVTRQALLDRGAQRVALLDDGSPEAALAARFLTAALGNDAVVRVSVDGAELEPLLHLLPPGTPRERLAEETRRLKARLLEGVLTAHPANKTELLLGAALPPEPLLPLGDLYASEVANLCGGWSASPEVRALAESAGGVEALDSALRRWLDGRDAGALVTLPGKVAEEVTRRFRAGRAARLAPRIVPKLGTRTLGVDLLE
ncbi:MAG TPA: hypothetical protein VF647_14905 [Longimicrobium sp.]